MLLKQKLAMMYGNMMPYTLNELSHDVISSLSKQKAGLSTWHTAILIELAKMSDPHLFMGAEADTDQNSHPEVPIMVHLNPPQLHMHAAEEGAVQRVQPQETSKPARSSADGKYPAPAIDKIMKFFAIMIRVDHCLNKSGIH